MTDNSKALVSSAGGWFSGWQSSPSSAVTTTSAVGSFATENGAGTRQNGAAAVEEDDDEAADQLLTQFPPYGTTTAQQHGAQDWFLMGAVASYGGGDGPRQPQVGDDDDDQLDNGNEWYNFSSSSQYRVHPNDALATINDGSMTADGRGTTGVVGGGGTSGTNNTSGTDNNDGGDKPKKGTGGIVPGSPDDWDADEQTLWMAAPKKRKNGDGEGRRGEDDGVVARSDLAAVGASNGSSTHRSGGGSSSAVVVGQERRRHEWVAGDPAASAAAGALSETVRAGGAAPSLSDRAADGGGSTKRPSTATAAASPSQSSSSPSRGPRKYFGRSSSGPAAAVGGVRRLASMDEEGRQHWMPDQLCKECYSCETPFTVFRRRHHCRLCGQVFCNNCSAYFVPFRNSTIRVCKLCNDQVAEKGGVVLEEVSGIGEAGNRASTLQDTKTASTAATAAATIGSASPLSSIDSPSRKRRHFLDAAPTATDSDGAVFSALSQTKQLALTAAQTAIVTAPASSTQRQQLNDLEELDRQQQIQATSAASQTPHHAPTPVVVATSADGVRKAVTSPEGSSISTDYATQERQGKAHLGMTAANHMEVMARRLLHSHAPLLLESETEQEKNRLESQWINALLSLATRCCSTVAPNVKKGDLLDIRPYCKVKVVPGGSFTDCAYLSGVMFRKTVSHKKMAKEIETPRIMILSGGIEFSRAENRIASLETLFEQEEKFLEIKISMILKKKPDVLIVGRSVSRRGQELLLKAGVVLIQQVKPELLRRISRQTGASVVSNTDFVMSQFGDGVIGKCHRFRLVTFRDNELWTDKLLQDAKKENTGNRKGPRSIEAVLADEGLSTHERQAALAASKLGQGVLDGTEAVRTGLAKRGVAQTYCMFEGCPKRLGCTVVLRGASRAALKQAKTVFRFLVNVAYNLHLELSYFRERGARIRPDFEVGQKYALSSSLCVDYGQPPGGKKIRPWNGTTSDKVPLLESGEITAFDHQSILITSVWMTDKTQCCPAEVKGICYYSLQDVALGQFLRDSCFNLSLKCQNPNCKKSVLDHSLSFVHNDGLINITVRCCSHVATNENSSLIKG